MIRFETDFNIGKSRWDYALWKIVIGAICGVAVFFGMHKLWGKADKPLVVVDTPSQLEEIRSIRELEVAHFDCEELYEFKREGRIFDDELTKVYYAKLRIGIDLSEVKESDIEKGEKKIKITLPDVRLLNEGKMLDFSRTFSESGDIDNELRREASKAAEEWIVEKYVTEEVIQNARRSVASYIENYLRSIGYEEIEVVFVGCL